MPTSLSPILYLNTLCICCQHAFAHVKCPSQIFTAYRLGISFSPAPAQVSTLIPIFGHSVCPINLQLNAVCLSTFQIHVEVREELGSRDIALVIYCCLANHYKLRGLEQRTIISWFLWVRSLGMIELGPLLSISKVAI